MTRRIVLPALVAVTLLALAAPAQAVPPNPNHTLVRTRGRTQVILNHAGDPALGSVVCSSAGEDVDTNANSLADALRGRGACRELGGNVVRVRISDIRLQVVHAETWEDVAIDDQDVVSSAPTAYAINYTPTTGYCPEDIGLTYRVRVAFGIRWHDGQAFNGVLTSLSFQDRAVANTVIC
jgi:hypothetical protein